MANKEQYITIAEFAERAGVSHQFVYKKMKTDLQPYVKLVASKKMLNIKGLALFDATKDATVATKVATDETTKELISMLKMELEAKNKQIENLQKLLDQEQQLNAVNQQKVQLLEEKAAAEEEKTKKRKWWKIK